MPTGSEIDPLAQLAKDLAELERTAPTKPRWDPADAESMIDWLEQEVGITVRKVPKHLAIVRWFVTALQEQQRVRMAIVGPRGGGKTMLAAALQLLSLRFFGASWTSIGGSLEQANRLFAHVRNAVSRSNDLQRFIPEALASRITGKTGGCITVHAASEKSIRGQHPRGPSGAGGIVLDEAALIEDRIIDAALPQVASASPSLVIQLSTLGEDQSGRFWDLLQDPKAKGYKVFEFGIFDTVARCPFDCASSCPVPAFAKDQTEERPNGTISIVKRALCAGRAHEADGWIDINEVAQQYKDLPHEAFGREFLGTTTSRVGAVYRTEDIDAANIGGRVLARDPEEAQHRFLCLEKSLGLDWGYSPGETWAVWALRLRDRLLIYRFDWWSGTRFSEIRKYLVDRIFEEHVEYAIPDGASPSDNDDLRHMIRFREEHPPTGLSTTPEWYCRVLPGNFGTIKEYAVGECRRRLEDRKLLFPTRFNGTTVNNFERAMRLLKAYRYDQNGHILKKDDHVCDALSLAVLPFSPRRIPQQERSVYPGLR